MITRCSWCGEVVDLEGHVCYALMLFHTPFEHAQRPKEKTMTMIMQCPWCKKFTDLEIHQCPALEGFSANWPSIVSLITKEASTIDEKYFDARFASQRGSDKTSYRWAEISMTAERDRLFLNFTVNASRPGMEHWHPIDVMIEQRKASSNHPESVVDVRFSGYVENAETLTFLMNLEAVAHHRTTDPTR